VFAPTDEAFARLPEGTVATLLKPENKEVLQRVLTFHVVPGKVLSTDLLRASSAKTLANEPIGIGLRVGDANVTVADIECSNGVIHVIDSVLLPPAEQTGDAMSPRGVMLDAIDRGVPVYNAGDAAGCARIYREAAKRMLASQRLAGLHAMELRDALLQPAEDASAEAWQLRERFDAMLADMEFEPRMEAPLPEGFPGPGPVAQVVRKRYPSYRAARAGGDAFWTLFNHIKKNDVAMTAPVEMTMDDGMRMKDMAFLYESAGQGHSGKQGDVAVLDLGAREVLSVGLRGRRSRTAVTRAKLLLQSELERQGLRADGPFRVMGYNSPMVPAGQQFWELQGPIAEATGSN
jgi:hypothetical protein